MLMLFNLLQVLINTRIPGRFYPVHCLLDFLANLLVKILVDDLMLLLSLLLIVFELGSVAELRLKLKWVQ